MKTFNLIILILFLFRLSLSAVLPTEGKFHFTLFKKTNSESRSIVATTEFIPDYECTPFIDGINLKLLSWDATISRLEFEAYAKNDCSGKYLFYANLRCNAFDNVSFTMLTDFPSISCYYKNFKSTGRFEITGFTENTCKNPQNYEASFDYKNSCWNINDSFSIIPIDYTQDTNRLYFVRYDDSTNCDNKKFTIVDSIVCDNVVCTEGSADNKLPYLLCKLVNSSIHLITNLTFTFALFLFLF